MLKIYILFICLLNHVWVLYVNLPLLLIKPL